MPNSHLPGYLSALGKLRKQTEATPELSLREPLLQLIGQLATEAGRSLLIAPEADAEEAGQPDVFVKDGARLIGFVETKAPGTDLGKWLSGTKQGRRYREFLPNWIATDYYRFIFVRDGTTLQHLAIADPTGDEQLLPHASEEELAAAFAEFFAYAPPVIRSPKRLAIELSRRARLLRDGIEGVLKGEPDDGPLRGVLHFYRERLMSDLDEAGFADTFAQTIAYGLFLARLREEDGDFTLAKAIEAIPQSVPFLRSAVRLLTEQDVLPKPITNLVDDLVALLDNTRVDAIRKEIETGGLERDLVIYFYERFLEKYDAGERKKRGVYYTPPELVSYLIRAAEATLRSTFGLDRGFADEAVNVLDPAVGTGTFLLGVAEQALLTEQEQGTASQRKLVREHLLPHFFGFELLPAPYAIAHLKLSSFYEAQGYELSDDERIRVYLTNSLESDELGAGEQLSFLPMVRGIVEEGRAAGHVKHKVPVLVVLGNPPYERTSHNANPHSNALLDDFYRLDGKRLQEKNTGPLQDDYLRFIRWSVWKLLEQPGAHGQGILALVTNRAYLERKLHRAVRHFLLRSFDEIHVFDLHGDQREWFADRTDEKVFKEVQAGIALTVFVKRPDPSSEGLAAVRYRESFGNREEKYKACRKATIEDESWQELEPHAPLWLFVPYKVDPEYDDWPSLEDLFPTKVVGFQTHRDQLVVAFTQDELKERLDRFADPEMPDSRWIDQGIRSNRDWDLGTARQQLRAEGPRRIMKAVYRGLERRWIAFDERLIDYIRTKVSPHLLDRPDNLALAFAYGSLADGPYVLASRTPVPAAGLSWRTFGTAHFAPLRILDQVTQQWLSNLSDGLLDRLAQRGIELDPDGFLHYVYAVLNAREYRTRYADALRYDYARIPISRDPELFDQVASLGRELTAIHLFEHVDIPLAVPVMDGNDEAVIAKPRYDPDEAVVELAPDLVARNVSPSAWNYQHGAYRVIREFLDARVGRRLSAEEFKDFRELVAVVRLTLDVLPSIEERVPQITQDAFSAEELLGA